jgi:hypothetical protein
VTVIERLERHTDAPTLFGCWLWQGAVVISRSGKPYGKIALARPKRSVLVHRLTYELFVGPLFGECDHLCQQTLCRNPAHLRDLSASANRWNHHRDPVSQRYVAPPLTPEEEREYLYG